MKDTKHNVHTKEVTQHQLYYERLIVDIILINLTETECDVCA